MILCDGSSVNSYGFRVDVDGINLDRFLLNPVMLYRHDDDEVIGKWENIRKEDGRLLAEPVFDTEDEHGKKVAGKVDRGFLKGCSMGIRILSMETIDGVDVATQTELLEASVCAIPSDRKAVILYDENRKQLTYEEVKLQFKNQLNTEEMKKEELKTEAVSVDVLAEKEQEIAELKAQLAAAHQREVEQYLSTAVLSGRITEAERPHLQKLSEVDFVTVKALVDERPQQATVSMKELLHKSAALMSNGREDWDYLEWMKKDPDGLAKMKRENPSEFQRLQQTLKVR